MNQVFRQFRQVSRLDARQFSAIGVKASRLVPALAAQRSFSSSPNHRSTVEPIYTPKGVKPIGPYSQAVKANGFVFVSGQIPAESDGRLIEGPVAEKTHKMCQNARAVLEAAGSSLDKVVNVTVFFRNMDDAKEMNEVYSAYFTSKPARSSCEATKMPAGSSMIMDIIAVA